MQTTTFFKTLSVAAFAVVLTAYGGQKSNTPAAASAASPAADSGAMEKEIVFDATVGDFGDMVKDQTQPVLEKKGYTIKLVEFTGYVHPNLALAEGELDINIFQRRPYLDDFKKEYKLDITEAFQMPIAPLGLYPGELKSLGEVRDGSSISTPSDPSNFAHALVMLSELGWVRLKDGVDPLTASKADTAENPKNIKIIELEAVQLLRSRADIDFAVANGNYTTSSGMKLTEALFQEPSFAYVNWTAVKTVDKDSQWLEDITEAYNSSEFRAYAHKHFEGYKYPAAWGESVAAGARVEAASTTSAAKQMDVLNPKVV